MDTPHEWVRGKPSPQPYFRFVDGAWRRAGQHSSIDDVSVSPAAFSIMSWNIDFMRSLEAERMKVALSHIRDLVARAANPSIIMLNEMVDIDLGLIQAEDWVQRDYNVTDISRQYWESDMYGRWISLLHVGDTLGSLIMMLTLGGGERYYLYEQESAGPKAHAYQGRFPCPLRQHNNGA
jgi:hypothetical protein